MHCCNKAGWDHMCILQHPASKKIDPPTRSSPHGISDGDVDDLAQNGHTSNSWVEKRAANQLNREHDVKPLHVFRPLLKTHATRHTKPWRHDRQGAPALGKHGRKQRDRPMATMPPQDAQEQDRRVVCGRGGRG